MQNPPNGQSTQHNSISIHCPGCLEKDPRTVPGRLQGLRIWPARGGHPSSLAGNLTNFASQEEMCKIHQMGNLLDSVSVQ